MLLVIGVLAYAVAMLLANLLVVRFGPEVTTVNAFVLIGLDLALRDLLNLKLSRAQMVVLISITGGITYVLNPAAERVAMASAVSFLVSGIADWGVFAAVKGKWLKKSVLSNVGGAAVDSVMFPTIAFGVLMPDIVLKQFLAKVLGGAVWAYALSKIRGAGADRETRAEAV